VNVFDKQLLLIKALFSQLQLHCHDTNIKMSITLSFVKKWGFHINYLHLIYYEFILSMKTKLCVLFTDDYNMHA